MKKLNLLLLVLAGILLLPSQSLAQTPDLINYQAVARDGSGDILSTKPLLVQFTIYSGSPVGTLQYRETFNLTTNSFGLFSCQIGSGTPVSGSMSGISWANDSHYLKIEIDDGTGLGGYGHDPAGHRPLCFCCQ